jgi:acetyltransferase-like isoleucine patch superfamily enzyme
MLRHEQVPPRLRRVLGRALRRGDYWVRALTSVGADDDLAERFAHFGRGTCLTYPFGAVVGERWISLGADTLISPHVTLSAGVGIPLDLGPAPILRIGDRCSIGRGSHFVGHYSIDVGDDVFTGPYVYVTDQNHRYDEADVPIGRQWPPVDEPVVIGSGSWLGAGAIVLPGTTLGRNVTVAAGSVVRGEFPDHCVVAGVPGRIIRRRMPNGQWEPPLREAPTTSPNWDADASA